MSDIIHAQPALERARHAGVTSATTIHSGLRESDDPFPGSGAALIDLHVSTLWDVIASALNKLAAATDVRSTVALEEPMTRVRYAQLANLASHGPQQPISLGWRGYRGGLVLPGSKELWRSVDTGPALLQWLAANYSDSPLSRHGGICYDGSRLAKRVRMLLLEQPLEDGRVHEAETILEQAAACGAIDSSWAAEFAGSVTPKELPDLVVLLARVGLPSHAAHRERLLTTILVNEDPSIRLAAVQALELWGDKAVLRAAASHEESVPWIRDYLAGVIRDINSLGS